MAVLCHPRTSQRIGAYGREPEDWLGYTGGARGLAWLHQGSQRTGLATPGEPEDWLGYTGGARGLARLHRGSQRTGSATPGEPEDWLGYNSPTRP